MSRSTCVFLNLSNKPKIADLCTKIGVEENVGGLDVAVNELFVMQMSLADRQSMSYHLILQCARSTRPHAVSAAMRTLHAAARGFEPLAHARRSSIESAA